MQGGNSGCLAENPYISYIRFGLGDQEPCQNYNHGDTSKSVSGNINELIQLHVPWKPTITIIRVEKVAEL